MAQYPSSAAQQQHPTLQPDRQRPYTVTQQVNELAFTNIHDTEGVRGEPRGKAADGEKGLSMVPSVVTLLLGSTYFLIVLCILLIIPIIELAIGASFRDQCSINPNIPIYLIVTGACGMATIVLTLLIGVSLMFCLKKQSLSGSFAAGCIIGLIILIIMLMSFFLLIWFIVGNVWVFSAKKTVDYDNISSPNYCHRTVYQFAFTIIILTYVMTAVSCCSSCLRCFFKTSKST